MIGEECVCPMWAKHSDWCGLAGIIQAIVEMFPKNCALMFPSPLVPMPPKLFSGTFRPASSNEDDNNDDIPGSLSFRRFGTSSPMPSVSGCRSTGGFSRTPSFASTPLPHRGAFHLAGDPKEMPSSAVGAPPGNEGAGGQGLFDEGLDMALEADDEADADKEPTEDVGDELDIDPEEVQMLKQNIKPTVGGQPSTTPKSGEKWGSTHLNGDFGSLDSSSEDLDVSRGTQAKKKTLTPTKVSHPNQWSKDDINIVHQIRYKMDLQHFQTYHTNKIDPADLTSINTRDHSPYLKVAWADPRSVIKKSVFSMAAYRATLKQQGWQHLQVRQGGGHQLHEGCQGIPGS